jgi:hypothetical protein
LAEIKKQVKESPSPTKKTTGVLKRDEEEELEVVASKKRRQAAIEDPSAEVEMPDAEFKIGVDEPKEKQKKAPKPSKKKEPKFNT